MGGAGWWEVVEGLAGEDGVEDFQAVNEAWAGAGEVGGAVDGVDAVVAYSGKLVPLWREGEGLELGEGFGQVVAAGH